MNVVDSEVFQIKQTLCYYFPLRLYRLPALREHATGVRHLRLMSDIWLQKYEENLKQQKVSWKIKS
jgi:hypothetical protein